ncbi:hypothetical protein ACQP2X_27830 [Actinoplanes sp. CA-131856]
MTGEWIYNHRPEGARFLPGRVAEPARTEIEDDIWAWVVRGEEDAAEFAGYLDGDEVRAGVTDEDFDEAAHEALPESEQEAAYLAAVEHLMDDVVFPVLHRHGMRPDWNRTLAIRVLVSGAHWYAPLAQT